MSSHFSFGSTAGHQDVMLPSRKRAHRGAPTPSDSEHLGGEPDLPPMATGIVGGNEQARSAGRLRIAMVIVACLGFAFSSYLAWAGLTGSSVVGCDGGTFDCNHVLTSRWSKVAGVPVGIPAAMMYVVIIACLVQSNPIAKRGGNRSESVEGTQPVVFDHLVTFCVLAAAMSAIWFIGLQFVSVGSICVYCMVAHACGLTLATLVLWKSKLGTNQRLRIASAAAIAVTGLIVTQWQSEPPKTFRVENNEAIVAPVTTDDPVDDLFAAPGDDDGMIFDAPDPTADAGVFEAPDAGQASSADTGSNSDMIFAAPN